jgi:hypothetical protein
MSEIGTEELSLKAEYRLKIRLGGPLFQLVNLRTPATPGADYLFHVSNSHVKVDPKFVTDNLERVLPLASGRTRRRQRTLRRARSRHRFGWRRFGPFSWERPPNLFFLLGESE